MKRPFFIAGIDFAIITGYDVGMSFKANLAVATMEKSLADLRSDAGFSQREAAERIGLTQPRLCQIERDGCDKISTEQKIASAYGVPVEVVSAANRVTKDR